MQNQFDREKEKLALMQKWAMQEMKKSAETTQDPQLKKKYEQTAAINRIFYEQFSTKKEEQKEKSDIQRETETLLFAFFVQNTLFKEFSALLTRYNRPEKIDEICDRQVLICREILDEAENRMRTVDEQEKGD